MKKIVRIRRKKPKFIRLEHIRAKVKNNWHKPHGKFGRRKQVLKQDKGFVPKEGRRMPKEYRGLHPSGLEIVEVENVKQLDAIDPKIQGAKIRSVGNKKRIDIINAALKKKIRILNVRNPEEKLKSLSKKKKDSKEAEKKKETKEAEKKKETKKSKKKTNPAKKDTTKKETKTKTSSSKTKKESKK